MNLDENVGRVMGALKEHGGSIMPSDLNGRYQEAFVHQTGADGEGIARHPNPKASSLLNQLEGIDGAVDHDLAEWVYESDVKTLVLTAKGRKAVGL